MLLNLFFVLALVSSAPVDENFTTKMSQKPEGADIINITPGPKPLSVFPQILSQISLVNTLKAASSPKLVKEYVTRMTQFPERYYKSKAGAASAAWIYQQIASLIPAASQEVVLTVRYFNHSWLQPSVIARLEAKNPAIGAPSDIVITGSHFDTLARYHPDGDGGANPGADDAASGCAVVHETLRVLISNNVVPKRPIEFHFYAAEEVGLWGSAAVAEDYATRKVNVFTYLNLDQSGYVASGLKKPQIGIITDFVSAEATNFARLTVAEYTSVKTNSYTIAESRCGYACTDNASWSKRGYNAALVFEGSISNATPYNDVVNRDGSPLDTLETLNWNHIQEFVHHTIGYIVELTFSK